MSLASSSLALGDMDNFVVMAQTKNGKVIIFPCVGADPGVALFVDVFKAKIVKEAARSMGQDVVKQSAPRIGVMTRGKNLRASPAKP